MNDQRRSWAEWIPVLEDELDKEMQKAPAISRAHAKDHIHYYDKSSIEDILNDIDTRWNGFSLDETRMLAAEDYKYIKNYFERLKQELGA